MRKLITILMTIMTLLAIISCNGNTPQEVIVPPATTGTLSIDFCNFFGATMHYDIYNSYSIDPIISADTDKDTKIELEPGSYYISASLVGDPSDIKLWATNEDDSPSDPAYKHSFSIEIGRSTLLCFKITNNNKSGNARVAINPTYGKELLGNPNAYGDDVSISYTIRYGTDLKLTKEGITYDDLIFDTEYAFIDVKPEFTIKAVNKNGDDVSEHYVIFCPGIYDNAEHLSRDTITKCINIYRGCKVEFRINEPLKDNQSVYISCEQFRGSMDATDGIKLAYDKPFDVSCYIKTPEGDFKYCDYENMIISEGDSTVIILQRNIN